LFYLKEKIPQQIGSGYFNRVLFYLDQGRGGLFPAQGFVELFDAAQLPLGFAGAGGGALVELSGGNDE
jgi:hypothetical protein